MGGDFQPQGHSQIVMNVIDFGMNTKKQDAPRWDHKGSAREETKRQTMEKFVWKMEFHIKQFASLCLGHNVGFSTGEFGGYQAILWDAKNQVYRGASESRKDGQVSGY